MDKSQLLSNNNERAHTASLNSTVKEIMVSNIENKSDKDVTIF